MKRIFEPLSTAWTAVMSHKLRSFLTILGVVIGIAAVIILMSIGKGAQASILNNFNNLGVNMIYVSPGSSSSNGVRGSFGSSNTLTLEDAEAIEANIAGITGVAPTNSSGMQVVAGGNNMFLMATGVTPEYLDVNSIQVQEGDPISQNDYDRRAKVVLVGATVAETLFGEDDPVGQKIRMGNNIFTITGLLASKGESFNSVDRTVLVPLSTLQGLVSRSITTTGKHIVSQIAVQAADKDLIATVKEQITFLLEQEHDIPVGGSDDFSITSTDDITSAAASSTQTLTWLLGSIAGISLLVGGIGVMNIMLVSVMERRREIGVRKALGARERDIWGQFLVDSALLTMTGGVVGVGVGWGGSYLIGHYFSSLMGGITTLVTSDIVILAVVVSVGIGLFFGFYPAWQGSRLDPIQALRSE
jgi:putative ABC transport system permease protein